MRRLKKTLVLMLGVIVFGMMQFSLWLHPEQSFLLACVAVGLWSYACAYLYYNI